LRRYIVKTIYHPVFQQVPIIEPVLIELEQSIAIQRLKKIDQSGAPRYFIDNFPKYSRYEHSIGVYELLRCYDCTLDEQISGLLHDASHTAFSHIAELLYKDRNDLSTSYQDDILIWYLQQQGIDRLLNKYSFALHDLDPQNNKFLALEQELPNLCADRIEYNLHHAVVHKLITLDDVGVILSNLKFHDNNWFFTDTNTAKKFAELSLYFSEKVWGAGWNLEIYKRFATVLLDALNRNIIDEHELHFSSDMEVLDKLDSAKDTQITELLDRCRNFNINNEYLDKDIKAKFRGVDPFVLIGDSLKRLSSIDDDFAKRYLHVKQVIST